MMVVSITCSAIWPPKFMRFLRPEGPSCIVVHAKSRTGALEKPVQILIHHAYIDRIKRVCLISDRMYGMKVKFTVT